MPRQSDRLAARPGGRRAPPSGLPPVPASRLGEDEVERAANQTMEGPGGDRHHEVMDRAEDLIMECAARQRGLVTRDQVLRAGLGADALKYRIRTRRLSPVHRGVYRVGPVTMPLSREMAAVLACGPEALISHRTAAALWELLPPPPDTAPVYVTVRSHHRRRRAAVRVRCAPWLESDEITEIRGIPATTPARTVLDLAEVVSLGVLDRAVATADRRGLADRAEFATLSARHPRRRGSRALRELLERGGGSALTRSEAEERLLSLIRKARLPEPETNVRLGGHEVDFYWPVERLVVEVDGFAYHSSRSSFEGDRRRDGELAARGHRVIRLTWRQIVRESEATLARLAQALAMAGSR